MKIISSFFIFVLGLSSVFLQARNPFEFADEELKEYVLVKTQKEQETKKQQNHKWKITKTKSNSTHIIEDNEGNVRSISFREKN